MRVDENGQVKIEYNGCKFRTDGETVSTDMWGHKVVKPNFRMARGYLTACQVRQNAQDLHNVRVQKEKLKFQLDKYGEVDYVDKLYYLALCKRVGYSCPEFDKLLG